MLESKRLDPARVYVDRKNKAKFKQPAAIRRIPGIAGMKMNIRELEFGTIRENVIGITMHKMVNSTSI